MMKDNNYNKIQILATSIAAGLLIFTIVANRSPIFAAALSKVAIIDTMMRVLTFREYTVNEDNFKADIKVPVIDGLKNKALQNSLNKKYNNKNENLYEKFMADMNEFKEKG